MQSSASLSPGTGSSGNLLAMTHQRSSSQSSLVGESKEVTKGATFDMTQFSPEGMAMRMNRQLFEDNQKKHEQLVTIIQANQADTKKDLAEIKQMMASSQATIMARLDQLEANVKNHVSMEMDKLLGIMGAQFQRLLSELSYLKSEVKKAQFSVELSRIRDAVRVLEDYFDQMVDQIIASSQVEDLSQEEYTDVVIEDRLANKQPYRIGDSVYFLNQNVLTMSGQLGPQIDERFLGQCHGKSIGGTWKDNIRMYIHNSMLSYVIEEIMYYNRKYGLSLDLKDFTQKELNRPPPMSQGTVADYSRAKIIVKGCVVCGMSNLPTDPVKQKCQNCKGKPRGKSGICAQCHRWGYFGDLPGSLTCVECKPKSCCSIM